MIQDHLGGLIRSAIQKRYDQSIESLQIDDAQANFGDYASNVAFRLAKTVGKSPREIAADLASDISDPSLTKVEAAGAGFLNFTMAPSYWQAEFERMDAGYGHTNSGGKIQVEYISSNPTGPMTLANARGGFIGDVLSNVMATTGAEVIREFYVNDAGTQIGKLVESLKVEAGLITVEERQYQGEYLNELLTHIDINELDEAKLRAEVVAAVKTYLLEPAITRLGLHFDHWQSEAAIASDGLLTVVLENLRDQKLVAERDGATWFTSEQLGDERDRVIVRSDGAPTYLLGDLAYHYDIFANRGFSRAIKIWGADHAGQVASLTLGTTALVPISELNFVLLQFVRLVENGQELKMSKRAGVYVTIDELMEALEVGAGEHAAGVARWFFLSRSVDQRIDFDLALAREQSAKNPYYYVMYAYARAHSLLAKVHESGIMPATSVVLTGAELDLVRKMARLPNLLSQIMTDYGVHRLTFYGYELATLFQDYYETNRIIGLPQNEAADKLAFIEHFIAFMDRYWALLGITPTARMVAHPTDTLDTKA